mgnify:CR=1 FL=1|jgi:hypothetical protein
MFCLPAIGVSACARTLGHATPSLVNAARARFRRERVAINMTVAMRHSPFSAAATPRDLPVGQAFRPLSTLHDSVRSRTALPGTRPARYETRADFARLVPCREIDSLVCEGQGKRFNFGGVKCEVPEVPHP